MAFQSNKDGTITRKTRFCARCNTYQSTYRWAWHNNVVSSTHHLCGVVCRQFVREVSRCVQAWGNLHIKALQPLKAVSISCGMTNIQYTCSVISYLISDSLYLFYCGHQSLPSFVSQLRLVLHCS